MEQPKIPPQSVSLTCPVCGAPIQAEMYNLVDVGVEPELKGKLLRGRINVARCSNCGSEGVIAAPILYHDASKELLLAFIPAETQLNDQEQQRIIGNLTNVVMSYLPPEERKGYLLVPKVLLSYQGLLETILQAEGITPEIMATQRARMELLDRLWQAMPNEADLRAKVAEVDAQLDFEFFAVLGAYIEAARQDGQEDRARALEGLRERLLELSTYGRQLAAQMLSQPADRPPLSPEELLAKILGASSEEELKGLVAWYRSAVDYRFFQLLTERMEAAEREGQAEQAGRLRELRERLLQVTDQLDQEAEAALKHATELLRQLLDAEDAEAMVRQRLGEYDDAFFIVLGANLQAAQAAGREDAHQRLQELGNLVLQVAQEKLPPPVRLIRLLLAAPDDAAVPELLQENESAVDEHLVALMRDLAGEVEEEETASRLRQLAGLVEQWLREQS
jgi:hypothetical protein